MTPISVGIDVSYRKVDVSLSSATGGKAQSFSAENTSAGHQRLVARLLRYRRPVRVCVEATGVYGFDLALTLASTENIAVMVVNPRRARRFAEVMGLRSKTDRIDAYCLLQFCTRIEFEPWEPPLKHAIELRTITRRLNTVIDLRTQEKNRLHAANVTRELGVIREDIERLIEQLSESIDRLEAAAVKLINEHVSLREDFERLCSIPGIAQRSAVKLLGELVTMPSGLSARRATAYTGLDPRIFKSGSSVVKKTPISKRGNRYLRSALYMPAHNAIRLDPALKAHYDRLLDRGKTKMQAKVAIMRRILVIIQAIRRDKTYYRPETRKIAA